MNEKPKYKGKIDIAVWENTTKTGEPYLTLNIGGIKIPVWFNKDEPKEVKKDD